MAERIGSGGSASGEPRFKGSHPRRPQAPAAPTEYLVTSVGETPAQERSRRMHSYYVAMSVRLLCVGSLAFVRGWWIIIPALGAILLPYFAVMLGNAIGSREGQTPAELSPQALTGAPADVTEEARQDPQSVLIVVDAPAERRASATAAAEPDPTPPRDDAPLAPDARAGSAEPDESTQ